MAITVNNKKIRSLPEQVADNTRRIGELETPRELYKYSFSIELSGTKYIYFEAYSHKLLSDGDFDDNYEAILNFVKDSGQNIFLANGYDGTGSFLAVVLESGTLKALDHSNSEVSIEDNFFSSACAIYKIK